jgi:hypothetical protein
MSVLIIARSDSEEAIQILVRAALDCFARARNDACGTVLATRHVRGLQTTMPIQIRSRQKAKKERERSAERRMRTMSALRKRVVAVCVTHLLRGCALPCETRARLSALTLAALATGYHPDGSAPEPGFLKARRRGVLPVRRTTP